MAIAKISTLHLLLGVIQLASCTNPKPQRNHCPKTPFHSSSSYHPSAQSPHLLAFASCPSPRFDEFSEKILGTWTSSSSNNNGSPPLPSTKAIPSHGGQVEEVMRACGGAVQGIREMPLFIRQGTEEEDPQRLYHNRADDGFVFMDNGSYTSGPVHCRLQEEGGELLPDLVTSLSFSTMPRIRSIVTSIPLHCQTFVRNIGSSTSVSSSEDRGSMEGDDATVVHARCSDTSPNNIEWERETCCRMPSSSQSWMIQRVKWETFVSKINQEKEEGTTGLTPIVDVESINVNGWVCSQRLVAGTDDPSLWTHPDIGRLLKEQGSQYIIQMGGVDPETMDARAFLRCYDEEGKLNLIVYQEGQMIQTPAE